LKTPSSATTVSFAQATVKPRFQGGDANVFAKWVSENLVYPDDARKEKIAGRVMVQFVVGADGSVSDVKVVRSVHPLLDAEAVRVISSSPKWTPGQYNGETIAVTYLFPVIFQVK
jgi:TonB family protein